MCQNKGKNRLARGFTLIEVMITVTIVAILAAVAIPSYTDYVQRARLADAFDALASHRVQMEQAYLDNGNYGINNACSVATQNVGAFNVACALSNGGQSFVTTATSNGNNGMTGYVFTINETGARQTTAFPDATVPTACWLTRKGGC